MPEIAERFGVNPETVREWIREKKLPARMLGLRYYALEEDVERFAKIRSV